jgi:hypothetical protein
MSIERRALGKYLLFMLCVIKFCVCVMQGVVGLGQSAGRVNYFHPRRDDHGQKGALIGWELVTPNQSERAADSSATAKALATFETCI